MITFNLRAYVRMRIWPKAALTAALMAGFTAGFLGSQPQSLFAGELVEAGVSADCPWWHRVYFHPDGSPRFCNGFAMSSRNHQYRLPVRPALWGPNFGYYNPCWRQLPIDRRCLTCESVPRPTQRRMWADEESILPAPEIAPAPIDRVEPVVPPAPPTPAPPTPGEPPAAVQPIPTAPVPAEPEPVETDQKTSSKESSKPLHDAPKPLFEKPVLSTAAEPAPNNKFKLRRAVRPVVFE